MFSCEIKIKAKNAEKIMKTLEIENRGYVETSFYNDIIIFRIESNNFKSFQRTLDDLLEALSLSMKIIEE